MLRVRNEFHSRSTVSCNCSSEPLFKITKLLSRFFSSMLVWFASRRSQFATVPPTVKGAFHSNRWIGINAPNLIA